MFLAEISNIADAIQPGVQEAAERTKEATTVFSDFFNRFLGYIPTICIAVIVMIIGILISKICLKIMMHGLNRSKIDKTVNSFLRSAVKVVLYLITLTMVLTILGVETSSIVTVIGTAGIAIGLALQSSLSNLAGGIIILITHPFKVGDYIETSSAAGTVEAISILYTHLLSPDNKSIFIPNGTLSNNTMINHSKNSLRRADMVFSISYENDLKIAINCIENVLEKNELVLQDPAPVVRVLAYSASSIDIATRPWCKREDLMEVKFSVTDAVKVEFDKNGISIPYNQLEVHLNK